MLYLIAGSGEATETTNRAEMLAQLEELRDTAAKAEAEFWLAVEFGPDTEALAAVVKWADEEGVYLDAVSADDDGYESAQTIHSGEGTEPWVTLTANSLGSDEKVTLLALMVDPKNDDPADAALFALIEAVDELGVPVFILNDAMTPLALESDEGAEDEPEEPGEDEPEPEPEPEPAPAKKAAKARKAPAAPAAASEDGVFTKDELSKMGMPELSALARGQGIDPKEMRKPDLIMALEGTHIPTAAEKAPAPAAQKAAANGVATAAQAMVIVVYTSPSTGTPIVVNLPITTEQADELITSYRR